MKPENLSESKLASVGCPFCGARPGQACRPRSRRPHSLPQPGFTAIHADRRRLYLVSQDTENALRREALSAKEGN